MKLAGAYINDDTYGRLVALAMANNRTLAGQCRHLFDQALTGELQVPDFTPVPDIAAAPAPEVLAMEKAQSPAAEKTPAAGPLGAGLSPQARGSHTAALPAALERALPALNPEAFHAEAAAGAEVAAVRALPAAGTVPVAGAGVGGMAPVGTGDAATPRTPATGLPRQVPCADGPCGGAEDGARISTRKLMMNPPTTTTMPCRGRCRCKARTAPAPKTTLHAHGHAAPHSMAAAPAATAPHGHATPHAAPALKTPHAMGRDAR